MTVDDVVRRMRRGAKALVTMVAYRGTAVGCPVCQGRFSRFRDYNGRLQAQCPRCGALERHRLLWHHLAESVLPSHPRPRVLHVAPEPMLVGPIRAHAADYVSFDLEAPDAMVHGDLTDAPFPDQSFDVVVCSHVLEHIVEDVTALRELGRLLRPGGVAVVQIPVDEGRDRTYEDPAIVTPEARAAAFGQEDHVRIYGQDVLERYRTSGLQVDAVDARPALVAAGYGHPGMRAEPIYEVRTPS